MRESTYERLREFVEYYRCHSWNCFNSRDGCEYYRDSYSASSRRLFRQRWKKQIEISVYRQQKSNRQIFAQSAVAFL